MKIKTNKNAHNTGIAFLRELKINNITIGKANKLDKIVPRVPDNTDAKKSPIMKNKIAVSFSFLLQYLMLDKQKTETPNKAKEKGMGFPESRFNLLFKPLTKFDSEPRKYFSKI